ncbi:3-phosphoshikimate 1-carboxyvinyltransferase [Bifidobacterium xylocopae]|uniref:3-phosphoshikimate 1-carboxyvinyltransferase n=2 Tax=Bifidobacterium xylocopae TaxID=2493119 RepID=A0A366KEF2_9BIFI|nr:3-phosphoshikimate 1-carboxyvinyltransferase [Bifidobacterium xylocopae]
MSADQQAWQAPTAPGALNARVKVPGSKSLSNRYLVLAALGQRQVCLEGLLRSRDTDLMIGALTTLGALCHVDGDDPSRVEVTPPASGLFTAGGCVDCGLAGTVMRFAPALAMLGDGPTRFIGDRQAEARPMRPLLDGLAQLGAVIEYQGEEGHLPFTLYPPQGCKGGRVDIDSSGSSQFISGLLLLGSRLPQGLIVHHEGGPVPSLPHIRMTVSDLRQAGIRVEADEKDGCWRVQAAEGRPYPQLPERVQVEPDLSNAAPFLGAAMVAGGSVSVVGWPASSTQPGALLPGILSDMGAQVDCTDGVGGNKACTVCGSGKVSGLGDYDLSAAGELAPTLAALLVFADGPTRLHGIGHLRGHETNRLAALTAEINRVGGRARELEDGLEINPVGRDAMHPAVLESYGDHRMATFGALLGLGILGVRVRNIATTAKTMPDFVGMWAGMLEDGRG